MGAGVMELDHAALAWTLTYDEYDLVLEGTLEIEIDGRVISSISQETAAFVSGRRIRPVTPILYIQPTGKINKVQEFC